MKVVLYSDSMEALRSIGEVVVLIGAVLGAIIVLGRWAKPQIKRVLDIQVTPVDVYELTLEIHAAMMLLITALSEEDDPTEEEIQEAMAVLQRAGREGD